jgi:hypothetical protein
VTDNSSQGDYDSDEKVSRRNFLKLAAVMQSIAHLTTISGFELKRKV